jgi:hypothetical protein
MTSSIVKTPKANLSVVGLAAGRARVEHAKGECDDFDAEASEGPDGEQRVYCANCRRVVVRWGGS